MHEKKCDVIYSIGCDNCEKEYIGETSLALVMKLSEHIKHWRLLHHNCQWTYQSNKPKLLIWQSQDPWPRGQDTPAKNQRGDASPAKQNHPQPGPKHGDLPGMHQLVSHDLQSWDEASHWRRCPDSIESANFYRLHYCRLPFIHLLSVKMQSVKIRATDSI